MLLLSVSGYGRTRSDAFNSRFIQAAARAKPSVVSIVVYQKDDDRGNPRFRRVAYGSGTIIDQRYLVTNVHVVKKGNYYQLTDIRGSAIELEAFDDGLLYRADEKTDLAILKYKSGPGGRVSPIDFGDSNELAEGEWVLAIGNPYGLGQSITSGIVSSKGRDNIGFADIEDFIQSDVSINPGNSGGPLIDLSGRLVGINTAIQSVSGGFQGISFSIPSRIVRQVCDELIRHGRVRRGWIGFYVKELRRSGKRSGGGVEIVSIIKDSPAQKAGLRKGDVIMDVDGEPVATLGGVIRMIGNRSVGTRVTLTIERDGESVQTTLALREKNEYRMMHENQQRLFMIYGIEIEENADTGQVILSHVTPRTMLTNLRKGDIVLTLNNKAVQSLEQFFVLFNKSGRSISTVQVLREGRVYSIVMANE